MRKQDKNILKYFFPVLITAITIAGCRKGPQDPLLSFISRKNRVTGVWTAHEYVVNWIDSLAKNSWQFDTIMNSYHGMLNCNESKTFTLRFYPDGKYITEYHIQQEFEFHTDSIANDTFFSIGDTHYANGNWQFEGGSDGYEKKELLKLSSEKGEQIFEIVKLRNYSMELRNALPYTVTTPTSINYLVLSGGEEVNL